MLKDLLGSQVRAGILNFEMEGLSEPSSGTELTVQVTDAVRGEGRDDCLYIKVCRTVEFEPHCNYAIRATYFVEHTLRETGSLNSLTPQDIQHEVDMDPRFFAQEGLGFVSRISLLIAQASSVFGGAPLILSPQLHM